MRDHLLIPLNNINAAIVEIMAATELDFSQEQLLDSLQQVVNNLTEMVISMPDLTWDKARDLLSFETRSDLASIIGYAELLLDESNKIFTNQQTECIKTIRAQGKSLLSRLMKLENTPDE